MFRFISNFLKLRQAVKAQVSQADLQKQLHVLYEERGRDVVRRFSRGNISLQFGNYITAADIDRVFGVAPWRRAQ